MKQSPRSGPLLGPEAEQYVEVALGRSLDTLLRFPRFILIEPINRCNSRCIMCGIDFDAKIPASLDKGLFAKIAAEIGRHHREVEKVSLTLDGEPLLDKHLHEKIRLLKEVGVGRVNIASNASLLDETRARGLIEAGLDEIYITIDSLNQKTFEAIRVGLDFGAVYGNTRNLVRLRDAMKAPLVIRVQMVQQAENQAEPEAFTRHWRGLLGPGDQVVVQRAHNWASVVSVLSFGDEADINHIPCIALWGTLALQADGRVKLCCMDTACNMPMGDLRQQTIAEVWSSPALNAVRTRHLSGQRQTIPLCDGCTLWRESKRVLEPIRESA